MPELLLLSIK